MISARLTEAEYQRLQELCRISGLRVSTIIRKWLNGETLRSRRPKEINDLYTEINRIDVNINQIARKTNAGFATRGDMQELRYLMRAIEERMAEIASR